MRASVPYEVPERDNNPDGSTGTADPCRDGCCAGTAAVLVDGRLSGRRRVRPVVFKGVGMSWQDLVVAEAVLRHSTTHN